MWNSEDSKRKEELRKEPSNSELRIDFSKLVTHCLHCMEYFRRPKYSLFVYEKTVF